MHLLPVKCLHLPESNTKLSQKKSNFTTIMAMLAFLFYMQINLVYIYPRKKSSLNNFSNSRHCLSVKYIVINAPSITCYNNLTSTKVLDVDDLN